MARGFLTLLVLAAIAWSGYWWLGSNAQQTALQAWLQDRRAAGWVAEYSDLSVRGYPNRFDAVISDLRLADPDQGWAWSAPEFQILALSYKPNHIIAVWPQSQKISSLRETIDVTADKMQASVVFAPNTDLALQRSVLIVDNLMLTGGDDRVSRLRKATLTVHPTPAVADSHDIGFQAEAFEPARILKAVVDPNDTLPDVFDLLRIRLSAGFDAPWDRHAVEGRKPMLTTLDVSDFTATWGQVEFQAKGKLTFDTQGFPSGDLALRAKNWRDMIAMAVSAGALPSDLAQSVESGLGLLASLSGNPNTLDVPLSFRNQVMFLGPLPLGPAPQIRPF